MSNFMKAFDEQRDSYLAHYGVKGMQWGVRNEEEPVGQQPAYSKQDTQAMKQVADKVKNADAETVKEKRKRIVKNIVKGVAVTALVAGIVAGAVKSYAKNQTGEKQDLASSIDIIGQKISKKPGLIGDAVKKGFNMNTEETLAKNKEARKEAITAKFNAVKTTFSDMIKKAQEVKKDKEAFKNVNIPFGKASDSTPVGSHFKRGTRKISIEDIRREERLKKRGFKNIYNPKGYVETENSRVYKG